VLFRSGEIKLFETIRWVWSWSKAWKAAIPGLFGGPAIGLLVGIVGKPLGLYVESIEDSLIKGLTAGIEIALISALFAVLVESDSESNIAPNQPVFRSAKIAVTLALIILILITPAVFIWSYFSILLVPLLGCINLYAGGLACLQHLMIRTLLWWKEKVPWDYQNLLKYASDRMFLQQVGGGYKFTHILLSQHISTNESNKFARVNIHKDRIRFWLIRMIICISITSFCILSFSLPIFLDTWRVGANIAKVMMPRIQEQDRLLIDQLTFHFSQLKRGDIILFRPTDEMKLAGDDNELIRLVVGLPKELVELKERSIYICGISLSKFLIFNVHPELKLSKSIIPENSYLVMVNNPEYRDNNKYISVFVPQSHIIGRVAFRFWPPNRIGTIR
jgi:signal peptidase I